MAIMKRKDPNSKFKGKVSSKARFEKKLQRKDKQTGGKVPAKKHGKRGQNDDSRPSWALANDGNYQNAGDSDVDVDDIMDMVDREDDANEDLISGYVDSIEKQYENKVKQALITSKSGPVKKSQPEDDEQDVDDDEMDQETVTEQLNNKSKGKEEEKPNVYSDLAGHSYIENLALVRNKKAQLQEEIALTSDAIMSHPEANIGRIKRLFAMLDTSVSDPEYGVIFFNVQQTVTESLCVIFNDIIPNYRLAERFNVKETPEPMGGGGGNKHQLKRDTMKSYIYEKSVLQYYKLYIQRLQRMINAELDTSTKSNFYKVMLTTKKARTKLAYVACYCFAELLSHHYNFNARTEVISHLAKVLCNTSRADDFMRNIAGKAFNRLFKADTLGDASLEAVTIISDLVTKQNFRVSPLVFRTLLGLNLRELATENDPKNASQVAKGKRAPKKDRKEMSRKERKRAKHFSKLENELLEAEAVESSEKRHSHKTDIHTKLFALYFRFVKRCLDVNVLASEQEIRDFALWYRPLFPFLFQGVAQFSVYLNDVYIYELIGYLLKLIQGDKVRGEESTVCRLSSAERLCCLKTISQILTLSDNLLTIDFQVPYIILYELCTDPIVIYESMELLLECIEEMILKRFKQLSLKRVVSLIQRLVLLSLNLSGPEACAFLTVIKRLFQQHQGAAESLFEDDTEQWAGLDRLPEFCHNPELVSTREANSLVNFYLLLHQHASPYVRYLAFAILKHFSDPQGRTTNLAENRALPKKLKELNLPADLSHELLRSTNPLQVYNLLSIATGDLRNVFNKPPALKLSGKSRGKGKGAKPKARK